MLLDEQGDLEGLARRAGVGDHNAAFYLAEQLFKRGKEKRGYRCCVVPLMLVTTSPLRGWPTTC